MEFLSNIPKAVRTLLNLFFKDRSTQPAPLKGSHKSFANKKHKMTLQLVKRLLF